jgi:hypothetical protein
MLNQHSTRPSVASNCPSKKNLRQKRNSRTYLAPRVLDSRVSGRNWRALVWSSIPESMCIVALISNPRADSPIDRYIYEVCLFDEAKQKPKFGGSCFSLGYVDGEAFSLRSKLTKLVCPGDSMSGTSARLRVRRSIIQNRHTLEVQDAGMDQSAVFLYVSSPLWRILECSPFVLQACLDMRDTEPVDKCCRIGEVRVSDHRDDASVVSATGRERGESQG